MLEIDADSGRLSAVLSAWVASHRSSGSGVFGATTRWAALERRPTQRDWRGALRQAGRAGAAQPGPIAAGSGSRVRDFAANRVFAHFAAEIVVDRPPHLARLWIPCHWSLAPRSNGPALRAHERYMLAVWRKQMCLAAGHRQGRRSCPRSLRWI